MQVWSNCCLCRRATKPKSAEQLEASLNVGGRRVVRRWDQYSTQNSAASQSSLTNGFERARNVVQIWRVVVVNAA